MARTSKSIARLRLFPALLAAAIVLAGISCAAKSASADGGPTGPNPRLKTVELAVGSATMKAEVARTPSERERGLMFRTSLPEGMGMLFIFDSDQRLAFWMKNTTLPLSIAYISSDGTIREILDLEPVSLEAVQSERSVRYALEAPRGWFGRSGVRVGDSVRIPPLD